MLRRYQVWSCNADAAGPRSVQAENREQALAQVRRFQPGEPVVVVDTELMELAHPVAREGSHHPGQEAQHGGSKGQKGQ